MGELEKKKLDTFMSAFTKVNETFQQIFHDITEGGNGRMALDNPDNPFEGGLELIACWSAVSPAFCRPTSSDSLRLWPATGLSSLSEPVNRPSASTWTRSDPSVPCR